MKSLSSLLKISTLAVACLFSSPRAIFAQQLGLVAQAQVTPDDTVNTTVNQNGNISEITGGRTEGGNLFHSFQEFSVPTGNEAAFNNAEAIENIFSRVTGGNISNIDGVIRTNGTANLFLINPAGIIFGENARLDVGGSFIGSSADNILFPNDIDFSASDTQVEPTLTVNAPIGLGFRDNPGEIVNRAIDDELVGLAVPANATIGLIGGNILFEGGFASTPGGRIEVGSVGENSTVSLTEVEQGWNIGYEDVTNFQDISLTFAALIESTKENTGDVRVQGKNISLSEGSQIGITSNAGQAGNVSVVASESLTIDGNGIEVDLGDFPSAIYNQLFDRASGENSQLSIETPLLNMTNGGQINAFNLDSTGRGVDILINSSEIFLDGTIDFDVADRVTTAIFAQTFEEATGDGGTITIETVKLSLNNGGQINTETIGVGDAGNLLINASEFVELIGTTNTDRDINNEIRSSLQASTEQTITPTGDGGNIIVNTPRLVVKDGAQINSANRSDANGGNIIINAAESILLSGIGLTTESRIGRTGINVSTRQTFDSEFEATIVTTGNAGSLNITTQNLIIERGAAIDANTFSLGNGGSGIINVDNLTIANGGQISAGSLLSDNPASNELGQGGDLNIIATDSVSIAGTGNINGESVTSNISTIAEATGDAGNLTLTTSNLAIRDGGEIDASALGNEAAGNITIEAQTANLDRASIRAITTAGEGGNITLSIADNLTIGNESQISAQAREDANGGNIKIDSDFVVAFSSQPNGSDIIANAERGTGGNIDITAKSLFGIEPNETVAGNGTNDIDAGSRFGLDGNITIDVLDIEPISEISELPQNLTVDEQTTTKVCQNNLSSASNNTLVVRGKGGIARQPVEPLNSNAIVIGQYEEDEPQLKSSHPTRSFSTSKGRVTPARGVAVKENGQIILTSHLPSDNAPRNLKSFSNCI